MQKAKRNPAGAGFLCLPAKPKGLEGAGDGREDVVDLAAEQGQNDNDHDGDQDEDQSVLNQALALFPQIIELAHCSKSPCENKYLDKGGCETISPPLVVSYRISS